MDNHRILFGSLKSEYNLHHLRIFYSSKHIRKNANSDHGFKKFRFIIKTCHALQFVLVFNKLLGLKIMI